MAAEAGQLPSPSHYPLWALEGLFVAMQACRACPPRGGLVGWLLWAGRKRWLPMRARRLLKLLRPSRCWPPRTPLMEAYWRQRIFWTALLKLLRDTPIIVLVALARAVGVGIRALWWAGCLAPRHLRGAPGLAWSALRWVWGRWWWRRQVRYYAWRYRKLAKAERALGWALWGAGPLPPGRRIWLKRPVLCPASV